MRLDGRRALVTGASTGIGREIARELAARGARVAITARRGEPLEQLADELAERGAPRPVPLLADLSRAGAATELAAAAVDALGSVDLLVNNAGTSAQGLAWVVGAGDEGREVFETNLWAPLELASELVPSMRERGEGSVVNVTSLMQVSPFPALGHYAASKAALGALTQTLRLELASSGLHVLEVALGPIDTAAAAETQLMEGAGTWLHRTGLGDAKRAGRAIARAIERERSLLVYPRRLAGGYHLPLLARAYARFFARRADFDDTSIRRAGADGDERLRAVREAWESRAGVAG